MTPEEIARINALAQKSKSAQLSPEEKAEQARLRKKYISAMKKSLSHQLDRTVIVEPDGSRRPLKRR
ncbi:MAG: DUF896 domain-containing protein [Clostridiales bacterium]|nr:DUF896 domain-containing protein [Clostridiales bacterium]